MRVEKQALNINFSQGINTKPDPFQVPIGQFLALENSVFTKQGELSKRNGFPKLAALPDSSSTYLTTFNGNLTAIGTELNAYNASNESTVNKGTIQPVKLSVLSLIKNNLNQSQADTAISANGLVCTVYTDNPSGGAVIKYAIADAVTGQNISAPALIPITSGAVTGSARVFYLGKYFIIVFTNDISGVYHLQYIAINTNDVTDITTNADIASSYTPKTTVSWDGVVYGGNLYIAYNTLTGGQQVQITYLTSSLTLVAPVSYIGSIATMMSLAVDGSNPSHPFLYVSFYDSVSETGYALVTDNLLNPVLAPTEIISSTVVLNITQTAYNGVCTFLYEVANNYGYDSSVPTHYIKKNTITQSGTVGTASTLVRSVGLASKAFLYNNQQYFTGIYVSPYQPTYFVFNSAGGVVAKFAYENGPGYYTLGLPNVNLNGDLAQFSYLYKDLIEAVNKNTNVPSGTQTAGIYTQTGINLVSIEFSSSDLVTSEIASNLNIIGGILWSYDGYYPTEQNFHLYPDMDTANPTDAASWSATGGSIVAKPDGSTNTNAYYYQVTYEWSDNQGNQYKSAPSIPIAVTTTGSGTSGSITVNVPTLRLTYKTANPVKIVIYRWSVAQQVYYQTTSISSPLLNDTTIDYVTFVDTNSDTTILGNNIIYTTGGVVENIGPPASIGTFLFDDRPWLITAENQNTLWYGKQIVDGSEEEFSDLFTYYVAPSLGAQGSSGPITCGAPMDDKAIIFKKDAIYYFNGTGPDNTGANSQYSQPIFITGTVGCGNPNSIVLIPSGLMFQSDKGIWLLGRDLSTQYIGAPVEAYNSAIVQSALTIPGTTQVRFTLNNGVTLMYDYYFNQWGTFANIPAISSTLYNGLHTYLDQYGNIFQEKPGTYLDNSSPVLMSFTTSWLSLQGLRGYQRAYEFNFLGVYLSPHKLQVQVAYDYNAPIQSDIYNPNQYGGLWGSNPFWGSGIWGGPSNIEQFRVFNKVQLCKTMQITVNEVFDPSFGTVAGAGLTLSGIVCVMGIKRGWFPTPASRSIG